jgi:hypothetical protein
MYRDINSDVTSFPVSPLSLCLSLCMCMCIYIYIYIYIYKNNSTIVTVSNIQTCGKPPICFGIFGHYCSSVVEYLPEDSRKWSKQEGDLPHVCTLLCHWGGCLKIHGDLFYRHGTRIV